MYAVMMICRTGVDWIGMVGRFGVMQTHILPAVGIWFIDTWSTSLVQYCNVQCCM